MKNDGFVLYIFPRFEEYEFYKHSFKENEFDSPVLRVRITEHLSLILILFLFLGYEQRNLGGRNEDLG
jgi:hypothetical protein